MKQAILDDLVLAVDRALYDGHGMLTLIAELARVDLTVQRLQPSLDSCDDPAVYAALARLYGAERTH